MAGAFSALAIFVWHLIFDRMQRYILRRLRCSDEIKVHIKGARRNGCTKEEIRAVLMRVTVYGGVLAVREAVRCANQVFAEEAKQK